MMLFIVLKAISQVSEEGYKALIFGHLQVSNHRTYELEFSIIVW